MDTLDVCNITNLPGVVSKLYEFYMEDMNFNEATVVFSYNQKQLDETGQAEEDLAVYQL